MDLPEREPRPEVAAPAARGGATDEELTAPAARGGATDEELDAHRMRLLARLAPAVAHELGNPLAAIVAFSQLIRTDPRLPADLRRDAELLVEAAERARSVAMAFLDLARERPRERHRTRVAALVENVAALAGYQLSSAGGEIDVDVPDDVPLVAVDRPRMQQVLLALVIAAAGDRSRIAIRATTEASNAGVIVAISPAGPLPDADVIAGIVESHAGRLRIGRDAFEVRLPAARLGDDPEDGTATASRAAQRVTATVLVVDDEEAMRVLLARTLEREGHRVILASTASEAAAAIADRDTAIDAVLCDHHIGAASGVEVCTAILAARPDLRGRVAMMSADLDDPALRRYAGANDIELLSKPFDIATVVELVKRLAE